MLPKKYKVIFWDFDGVIIDSMAIRQRGFVEVLRDYPDEQVGKMLEYHHENGGLSRYVKFRYFFETIRNEKITDDEVKTLSNRFSSIMIKLLLDKDLLIPDTVSFIKNFYEDYDMHIVSGSDQRELREICRAHDLSKYFRSINGSPTPKIQLVNNLIEEYGYNKSDIALIGDSVNDYEAASVNEIDFWAYNNVELDNRGLNYIYKMHG